MQLAVVLTLQGQCEVQGIIFSSLCDKVEMVYFTFLEIKYPNHSFQKCLMDNMNC